ncbi:MAG: hypothetical protein JXR64_04565 [Spirochaetales bacterium]|nr:hypothetical protein [Spirochaetales bacterium]
MKKIGINVFITEGCRLTHESSVKLVKVAEEIFTKNGFNVEFPIISTTFVEKNLDNGISIYDFNVSNIKENIVIQKPHSFAVVDHKELSLFDKSETINLILVKSLHNTGIDSWPSSLSLDETNAIFVSETCFESSFAHSLMNHFGIKDQFHDPHCLSYGSEILRKDTKMSEDEKLILSQELSESITYNT